MRRRPTLNRQSFGVLVAVALVGALIGLLSAALRFSADALAAWFATWVDPGAGPEPLWWAVRAILGAAAAVAAVWLVMRFAPEAAGSGVQEIEGALAGDRPIHWRRLLPVKFVGAFLSLGSGMALGREGPTVQMGANLGALVSDGARLPESSRHVLVASGAAAGLAAAFSAPLAAVIFVMEEMRPQFHYGFLSIQSVLLAAISADLVTVAIFGGGLLIDTPPFPEIALADMWSLALYGILLGGVGVFFNLALVGGLDAVDRVGARGRLQVAAAVGAVIGLASIWNADVIGGGYEIIHTALSTHLTISGLMVLFFVRFGLSIGSYATGAPGGIFAPMLALGTLFGVTFGTLIDAVAPDHAIAPGVFAVAGMAAFFAATVRAPLTGIALAVEMTGDLGQLLPLLITCLAATLTAEALGGRPIYEVLLERTLARARTEAPS